MSRGSLGSLVIMERNHDEVPVPIKDVPNNPGWGVCVEDERQQNSISYHNDGAGQ